jgi:hypothetical protein
MKLNDNVAQFAHKAIQPREGILQNVGAKYFYKMKYLIRYSFYFILVLVIASCEKTQDEDFNSGGMLKNGSLEFGNLEPDNWLSASGGYSMSWDEKETFDGKHSLKIESTDSTSGNISNWYQSIKDSIPINKKVKLDLFIKLEKITGEGIDLMIVGEDNHGDFVFSESNQGITKYLGSSNWKMISLELKKEMPSNVRYLTVILIMRAHTKGAVYFDKISLSEL